MSDVVFIHYCWNLCKSRKSFVIKKVTSLWVHIIESVASFFGCGGGEGGECVSFYVLTVGCQIKASIVFHFHLKQGSKGEKGSPGPKVGQMMRTMAVAPSFPAL